MADTNPETRDRAMLDAGSGGRFCRECSYDLRGSLESRRCPECGREFDPAEPRTTRRRPRSAWGWWAVRAGVLVLAVALLAGGSWGWLWWGWHREQQALAAVRSNGGLALTQAGSLN